MNGVNMNSCNRGKGSQIALWAAAAVAALNRMLVKRGAKAISVEHYRRRFGFPVRPFYAELGVDLERWDWDEICEDFHRFVLEEPQQVRAEASTALMLAQERGWRQCILSALRQDKLASAVEEAGLAQYFDFVFGVDNLDGESKLARNVLVRFFGSEPLCACRIQHWNASFGR